MKAEPAQLKVKCEAPACLLMPVVHSGKQLNEHSAFTLSGKIIHIDSIGQFFKSLCIYYPLDVLDLMLHSQPRGGCQHNIASRNGCSCFSFLHFTTSSGYNGDYSLCDILVIYIYIYIFYV